MTFITAHHYAAFFNQVSTHSIPSLGCRLSAQSLSVLSVPSVLSWLHRVDVSRYLLNE